jgi:hypothetical protein
MYTFTNYFFGVMNDICRPHTPEINHELYHKISIHTDDYMTGSKMADAGLKTSWNTKSTNGQRNRKAPQCYSNVRSTEIRKRRFTENATRWQECTILANRLYIRMLDPFVFRSAYEKNLHLPKFRFYR